jgi:hypothetical protein
VSRLGLLAAAAVLAVLAVWWAPPAPPADEPVLSAIGRSLGGGRVALVDILFLRADALRRRGHLAEARSLYRSVLELDPQNVAAIEFLAGVYAFDLLSDAPDTASRFGWWREGWALLQWGLEQHPGSPRLLLRSADLLLTLPVEHPDLVPLIQETVGDWKLLGVEMLMAAARRTGNIPGHGRIHLARLVSTLPTVAAIHLAHGLPDVDRILALGDELLEIRASDLAEMRFLTSAGGAAASSDEGLPLDEVLRRGLAVVQAVAADRAASDAAAVRRDIARYRRDVPGSLLGEVLEKLFG